MKPDGTRLERFTSKASAVLVPVCDTTTVNVMGGPPASPVAMEGVSVTINAGVTTVTLGALAVLEPSGTVNVAEFVS